MLQDAGTLHRQIPHEYYEQLVEAEAQSARDLSDFDMEVPMHRPDGQVRWMRLRSRPHRMQDGRTIWDGVQTDVTERKQAEEALQETRNYLENLIDYANAPIIVWDTSFRITRFNHAFERLTGLKAAEALGEPLDMLFPEESKEQSLEHIGRTLSGERWEAVEIPILRADGSVRTVLWNSANIYDKDGKMVIATIAQGQDITERKKAEETLRESEQRFRLALRNAPVSVSAQDHNLRYVWAYNQRTARPEEIIGKFDSDIFTPEEAVHLTAIKRRVLDENVEVREQMWLDRPGGRMFLDVCFEPIRDGAGRAIGVGTATVDLTPMKTAEEALRESQALLSAVTEGIPDPIFVKDRESRIIMANPATLRVVGKSLEETIGKNDRELYNDPAIGEAIMANDRRIMDSGQMEVVEEVGQTSDGYRTFLSTKMPYRNSNGEIIGILGITRDITERKRMEEELRKSENQFKVLIDNLSSGVALVDEHGKFTIYNPAFLQMFGLFEDPSNIKNVNDQNWSDWQVFGEDGTLLHVDDHPVRKAAMTGKPVSNKLVGVKLPSGGELVWMLISAEPILKPDGKVDLLICTYHNVTERKQAEEALRETRNYLENLIDYANAPIIVWDTSFRITRFNHAFERLTGLRAAEALGKPLDMLFPEESKEQSLEHIGRTLSGERWEAVEIPILHADGSVRTVLWNSANIYDKDGKMVIATIAQGQDITERKRG